MEELEGVVSDSVEGIVALLGVIGLGLASGRISWRGISLGSSGVVFVALLAGHFGYRVPPVIGSGSGSCCSFTA